MPDRSKGDGSYCAYTGCYWGMQLMRAGWSVHVGQGVQGNTRGQILILSPLVTLSPTRHSASSHSSSSSSSRAAAAAAATHSAGSKPARACRTPEETSRGGRSHVPTSAVPTSTTGKIAACGLEHMLRHICNARSRWIMSSRRAVAAAQWPP